MNIFRINFTIRFIFTSLLAYKNVYVFMFYACVFLTQQSREYDMALEVILIFIGDVGIPTTELKAVSSMSQLVQPLLVGGNLPHVLDVSSP